MKEYFSLMVYAMLLTLILIITFGSFAYFSSISVEAKSKKKSKYILIGYEYRTVKAKVKINKKKYLGEFYITYYCPCESCCGVGGGKITASGTTPKAGRTVGVNPSIIPYGTKLQIGKKNTYVAEDTGGGIGTYHIDVFCNSHSEALEKGVKYEKVWAIKTVWKKKKVKVRVPIYEKR